MLSWQINLEISIIKITRGRIFCLLTDLGRELTKPAFFVSFLLLSKQPDVTYDVMIAFQFSEFSRVLLRFWLGSLRTHDGDAEVNVD